MLFLKSFQKSILFILLSLFFTLVHAGILSRHYESDFTNNPEGWSVSSRDNIVDGVLDVELVDVFGIDIFNDTNPLVIGDYTVTSQPVELSIDLDIEHILFRGYEVPRTLVLELRNHKIAQGSGMPYYSIWVPLGTIERSEQGFITYRTVLPNPQALELPAGWQGYGAEDSNGQPQLPEGVTPQDILKDVASVSFTTYEPGMFFGYTYYKLKAKNIRINTLSAQH